MASLNWYLNQGAFWAGVAWVLARQFRKDLTGVANKTREAERKRLRQLAVTIELAADRPNDVRRLAKHLHDDL